jgi:lipopolysaccharide/colanic/teichoic acid biosynthesis glycosyltransferase
MIINIIRGDIKLVGVRPLSEHYLGLYREDVKKIRSEIKPGFIPPFYADLPKTLEEIMESEKRYMELYLKNPIRTDMLYLMKSLRNVFLRGVRSQ